MGGTIMSEDEWLIWAIAFGVYPPSSGGGGGGVTYNTVTGTTQLMANNNGYITNNSSQITLTLPATSPIGSILEIIGLGAGGWKIGQTAGQNVQIGSVSSTVGTSGSVVSSNQFDSIRLVCIVANLTWSTIGAPQSNLLTLN